MPGVAHIPYLEKRPSGFFFRRRIPTRMREISNPDHGTNICLAMRTDVLSEAKTLARSLTALSDTAFALMLEKPMDHLSAQDMTLLTELARFQIAAHEATRAMADPRSEAAANAAVEAERACQDVLRHALATGNRETMRAPLEEVAGRLGICVTENTTQWRALAYEALKIMLDVSRERERREAGRYEVETIIFKSVMSSAQQSKPPRERPQDSVVSAGTCAAPPAQICRVDEGSGASQAEYPAPAPLARSMNSEQPVQTPMPDAPNPATGKSAPMSQHVHSDVTEATVCPSTVQPIDDAARPDPVILVDTSILTPASQAALKKGNKIELREAFDLYIELKGAGYGDNFDGRQKRFPDKGKKWRKTSENNAKTAASAWVDIIGNQPFFQIDWTEAEEALGVIARIPTHHGKKKELINTDGFRELADRADRLEDESAALAQAQLDQKASVTPAEREKADLDARIPRLRVATYLRHGRMPNRVAKMLLSMKIIDENPFSICTWSNDEEKMLKSMEDDRSRQLWDDRIHKLFWSPVFQGDIEEPGDPMFWAPLISRFSGTREEETLQAGPDDFNREDGIDYFTIRNIEGISVKSGSGERRIPVHPALIELDLMKLVELRRKQKQPRLFPHLNRGQTVNERLKLTRFQRLNLTHPMWRKAPRRAALI